jgi:hypothetical protein
MISDALRLIHLDGLLCSSQVKPAERFQRIVTFESSDTYRVLLMELKHGARGLSVNFSPTNLYAVWAIPMVIARADMRTQKHSNRIPGNLLRTGMES